MPWLFIFKICFTNKIHRIYGGGQLLVSGSQGSISRIQRVRFPRPRIQGSEVPGRKVSVPGFQVPEYQVQGPRVLCIRAPASLVSGFQGPEYQVLILDNAEINSLHV